MNGEINLAWMYPDLLNLHGERGNAQAFKHISDLLGIELKIDRIDDIEAKIDFDKYDILLFNCGELKMVSTIVKYLKPQLKYFKKYIKDKKTIVTTGTTSAFLGKKVIRLDGEEISGLGVLDMEAKERELVVGDDIYFELENGMEITGSQIQMVDVEINKEPPLGIIKYGYGNNGGETEGIIKDNIIFTNCLGPVFVKNPWFTEKIIREVCLLKGIEISEEIKPEYDIEMKSLEATKKFINMKTNNEKI